MEPRGVKILKRGIQDRKKLLVWAWGFLIGFGGFLGSVV